MLHGWHYRANVTYPMATCFVRLLYSAHRRPIPTMMALTSSRHSVWHSVELYHGHVPQTHPSQAIRSNRHEVLTRCMAEPLDGSTPGATAGVHASTAVSCGVPISSYNNEQALAAVSGKSFGCTMCGKCCGLAEDAEVWLNDQEVVAIAAHLHISNSEVVHQYLQPYDQVPGWWLLRSKQVQGPWPFEQHLQQQSGGAQAQEQQQQRWVGACCNVTGHACQAGVSYCCSPAASS